MLNRWSRAKAARVSKQTGMDRMLLFKDESCSICPCGVVSERHR